jgi:hypothetical protein
MLVFCEDCGERNVIDPDKVRAANNQYRCHICNFLNPYLAKKETKASEATPSLQPDTIVPPKQTEKPEPSVHKKSPKDQTPSSPRQAQRSNKRKTFNLHEEPYSRIFRQIGANSSILGAYIYHFSDGIMAYDIESALTDATINQIGKALSVCNPFGQKILKNTKEIYLVLDDQVAVSKNITRNSVLILLCNSYPIEPDITLVFNQAINNLQVFI